jgi:hypothetical protein
VDESTNLICLKLRDGDPIYFLIVETATRGGGLFEPAIDGIPSNSLYPGNRGLVQSLNAEIGNIIESCASALDSMVGCSGIGAESFAASAATISTTTPALGFVESVADDVSESDFSRQRTFPVWAAEALHCF